MSAFGQSVENSEAWEAARRRRVLVTYLRMHHRYGILHFQRNDGGISVGCSKHESFDLEVPFDHEPGDGLAVVMVHLAMEHAGEF